MNSTVPIWIGHHNINLNVEVLQVLCPGLYHEVWAGSIDFDTIVDRVWNTLPTTISPRVKRGTVDRVLQNVFEAMRSHFPFFGSSRPEKRIRKLVEGRLESDLSPFGRAGLRPSRHTFLVICAFAKLTLSQRIAEEMCKIIKDYGHEVSRQEEDYYMSEWHLGIRALEELSTEQNTFDTPSFNTWPPTPPLLPLMIAPAHNPFDTYYRGRSPLRLSAPLYPRTRSLGHRRSMQFALPRLSNTAWNSPILSPVLRPRSYHDELGQLHYQQEEMNWKLDGIDQKLDNFLWR